MNTQPRAAYRPQASRGSALPECFTDLDTINKMLAPAIILPEQFYCSPCNGSQAGGEVALMHAVLEDAVNCFQKQFTEKGHRTQRLAKEAEEWFFAEEDEWPFSFVNICNTLGIDPAYIRLGLARWCQRPPTKRWGKRRHVVSSRQLSTAA
ncbi:MAG: hypothetical protein ACRERD_17785 [Candidatus Binatia bacterium]